MFDTLGIIKAMADENRLRILMSLQGKELCVCTLSELLDLAPSTTSKHLSVLKQARLIESVKDGKFVYYRLTLPEAKSYPLVGPALEWVGRSLADSEQVRTDAELLREIIEKGEQTSSDSQAASAGHRLYRHVPGIHAIGNFERKKHAHN
ncbi:MAG: metalloregulator ArsR/SmtB family transcription factor [Planctomycetota bacterium]|jgi:ArsR family transcriptional regulator|nr:metalloregulator ArsR/SmtB family transcription factor [Planctomycetota bacterium]